MGRGGEEGNGGGKGGRSGDSESRSREKGGEVEGGRAGTGREGGWGERRERKKGLCVDRDTRSLEAGHLAGNARRQPAVALAARSQAGPAPGFVGFEYACVDVCAVGQHRKR